MTGFCLSFFMFDCLISEGPSDSASKSPKLNLEVSPHSAGK